MTPSLIKILQVIFSVICFLQINLASSTTDENYCYKDLQLSRKESETAVKYFYDLVKKIKRNHENHENIKLCEKELPDKEILDNFNEAMKYILEKKCPKSVNKNSNSGNGKCFEEIKSQMTKWTEYVFKADLIACLDKVRKIKKVSSLGDINKSRQKKEKIPLRRFSI